MHFMPVSIRAFNCELYPSNVMDNIKHPGQYSNHYYWSILMTYMFHAELNG